MSIKVRLHGAAAAVVFLPQQMGCIGFNVSVHTATVGAMVPQVNGFEPICAAAAAAAVASSKSNATTAQQYKHFHLIAAKKPLSLPHRVNGPLYLWCLKQLFVVLVMTTSSLLLLAGYFKSYWMSLLP